MRDTSSAGFGNAKRKIDISSAGFGNVSLAREHTS